MAEYLHNKRSEIKRYPLENTLNRRDGPSIKNVIPYSLYILVSFYATQTNIAGGCNENHFLGVFSDLGPRLLVYICRALSRGFLTFPILYYYCMQLGSPCYRIYETLVLISKSVFKSGALISTTLVSISLA